MNSGHKPFIQNPDHFIESGITHRLVTRIEGCDLLLEEFYNVRISFLGGGHGLDDISSIDWMIITVKTDEPVTPLIGCEDTRRLGRDRIPFFDFDQIWCCPFIPLWLEFLEEFFLVIEFECTRPFFLIDDVGGGSCCDEDTPCWKGHTLSSPAPLSFLISLLPFKRDRLHGTIFIRDAFNRAHIFNIEDSLFQRLDDLFMVEAIGRGV